ncbi:hypothetical protein DFH06DRAFT_1205579, partial [Mycena polygramma]
MRRKTGLQYVGGEPQNEDYSKRCTLATHRRVQERRTDNESGTRMTAFGSPQRSARRGRTAGGCIVDMTTAPAPGAWHGGAARRSVHRWATAVGIYALLPQARTRCGSGMPSSRASNRRCAGVVTRAFCGAGEVRGVLAPCMRARHCWVPDCSSSVSHTARTTPTCAGRRSSALATRRWRAGHVQLVLEGLVGTRDAPVTLSMTPLIHNDAHSATSTECAFSR